MIEKANFAYYPLEKPFKKKKKAIENQGGNQI